MLMTFKKLLVVLVAALLAAFHQMAFSAATPVTQLMTPLAANSTLGNGDYVSDGGGLSTYLSYFIEVPPGTPQLSVDIYDADIGAVAGNDFALGGSFNTTVVYTLIDPAGTVVSTLTVPPGGCPACHNAWTAMGILSNSYRDNFGTAAFNNNDGSLSWTGNWIEVDGNGAGAGAGNVWIQGGWLRFDDRPNTSPNPSLERQADLSTFGSAFFSFDWQTGTGVDNSDSLVVEVSSNGGSTWSLLENFTGFSGGQSGSRNYDISGFISSNTRIRFRINNGYTGPNEQFRVDFVDISGGGGVLANPLNGHWELRVDSSPAVTTGDDLNAFGLRAHDGDPSAGGTELNIYADSYTIVGLLGQGQLAFDLYPYVTSGCEVDANDFDSDGAATLAFTSRSGLFTQSFGTGQLSGGTNWATNTVSGWTTDDAASDYGVWSSILNVIGPPGQSGNIVTYYMGAYNAANPAPTSQPEANAVRYYLPSDGSSPAAGPVKPLVEQHLSPVSGPNPPVAGQVSRVAVTVLVANPTPHAITFSTPSNVVTANVPGGAVVYAGTPPQITQGSMVSEPAAGGSGNIVWNPGVVAAGGFATMRYEIDVTPPGAGLRIPVTGAPGSNGTRAQYLDETANAGQARATFQFGQLCELAVVEGVRTLALVSTFRAEDEDGRVVVKWDTASEVGTAGFYLYRHDATNDEWELVDNDLLESVNAPQGGNYHLVDSGVSSAEALTYALVEIETNGRSRVHGPYNVHPTQSPVRKDRSSRFGRQARRAPAHLLRQLSIHKEREHRRLRGRKNRVVRDGPRDVKIAVEENGIHYLEASLLAGLFELPPTQIKALIRRGRFSLRHRGQEVAWLPQPDGSGIYFYGEAISSPYTTQNIYWLRRGRGLRMQAEEGAPGSMLVLPASFREHRAYEVDQIPGTNLPLDPDSDFWFWGFLTAGSPLYGTKPFAFDVNGPASDPGFTEARLRVNLHGGLIYGFPEEHRITATVNGHLIGESFWEGTEPHTADFAFPQSFLIEGENAVEISAILSPGVFLSVVYVDSFELDYQRTFEAAGDLLVFENDQHQEVTVDGFSDDNVQVFDVSDPLRPRYVKHPIVEETEQGYAVSFSTLSLDGRYLTTSAAGIKSPVTMLPDQPSRLRAKGNRADYLVITTEALSRAALELAEHRARNQLRARVILLEDIVDEFNHGISSPHAIRDFLRYTYEHWGRAPKYVVLAGKGNFDYKDVAGLGGNLIPPLMLQNGSGLVPSDNRYADVMGDDGLPEFMVGRLPVLTEEELIAYLDKIRLYECSSGESWSERVLMMADDLDPGADFAADSERMVGLLPASYEVDRVYLAGDLELSRQMLFESWNLGVGLVNYVGHGSLDSFTNNGLMTAADVQALDNTTAFPFVASMTCMVGRFDVPGFASLGEELVRRADGGAIAVWAPTGLSDHSKAKILNDRLFRAAFHQDDTILGEVIRQSLDAFHASGGPRETLDVFQLLGDPALRLHLPKGPWNEPIEGGTARLAPF